MPWDRLWRSPSYDYKIDTLGIDAAAAAVINLWPLGDDFSAAPTEVLQHYKTWKLLWSSSKQEAHQICVPPKIVDPPKILTPKNVWPPKMLCPKNFDSSKILTPQNFWLSTNFDLVCLDYPYVFLFFRDYIIINPISYGKCFTFLREGENKIYTFTLCGLLRINLIHLIFFFTVSYKHVWIT